MRDAGISSRREWKAARREVESKIPKEEAVLAEGPSGFLFSDGQMAMWVEVHIAVTQRRIVWALPKTRQAGAVTMDLDQVVKYLDRVVPYEGHEFGVVALTARDPEYAQLLNDPTNPRGETDAVFKFDDAPSAVSTSIRGAIEQGVLQRGRAVPGSLSDYL